MGSSRLPENLKKPVLPSRYELIGHLADGWSSQVWRARLLTSPPQYVVLKILKRDIRGPEGPARRDVHLAVREAFGREALALARCAGPGVPKLIETLELEEGPVTVLESIDGRSLLDIGPLPRVRARVVLDQLLGILGRMHRNGWLHCDLNPGNVLVNEQGVYLVDFGAAMPCGLPPRWCWPLGRHRFMSPEHLLGRYEEPPYGRLAPASDVHQLACLYAWMLRGIEPFRPIHDDEEYETTYLDAVATFMVQSAFTKARAIGLDENDPFDRIMASALSPDVARRPQDAEVLRWQLRQVAPKGSPSCPAHCEKDWWQRALRTEGFFDEEEAALLANVILSSPPDAVILEIGSYRGRSTQFAVSALGPHRCLIAIDAFVETSSYHGHRLETLADVLRNDPRVRVLQGTVTQVELPPRIHVALIDGDHSFRGASVDLATTISRMMPGDKVLCHDHSDLFPGIVTAVQSLCYQGVVRIGRQVGSLVELQVLRPFGWLVEPSVYREELGLAD